MPNVGMRAGTDHLMKAMAQIKSTDDAVKLVDATKAIPIEDSLYLYGAKKPAEGKYDWYNLRFVSTIKPADAFWPLDRWRCRCVQTFIQ